MSLAIHITTHAPVADVEGIQADVEKLVAKLQKAQADDAPEATFRIYGTDHATDPDPSKAIDVETVNGKLRATPRK